MVSLVELGIAYRKAKADLYYSSHGSVDAIADYEEQLHANLTSLREKINGEDESWVSSKDFIGSWIWATKSVDMDVWTDYKKKHVDVPIFSSPADKWDYAQRALREEGLSKKPKAQFRLMAQCSLHFHVLSTLWMMRVGCLFDAKLSECSYGNRLRRAGDGNAINEFSLGSLKPYFVPFREWRDKGINAMRTALGAGKRTIALTADVSSFYHELNAGFMHDPAFVKRVLEIDLSDYQHKIHRLFIRALQAWASTTPLRKGLPVGLPASGVIANMALIELDRCIEKEVAPLYYGRYVDDILLVMENGANFQSRVDLWEWLFARSSGMLNWVDDSKNNISFRPGYLSNGEGKSELLFANGKNKVFVLDGETGRTLVDAIARQIYERASEWRAMPRLPGSAAQVGTDLLAATQSDGEVADNLRKADALTMRRAGFAIKLRDFEAYERDLEPSAWALHRRAFFNAFIEHVLVLPQFFDLAIYLPRVIRLATACGDFSDLRRIIEKVKVLCDQVQNQCIVSVKAWPNVGQVPDGVELLSRWRKQVFGSVRESIAAAFPPRLSNAARKAWHAEMSEIQGFSDWSLSANELQERHARLFSYDLAHMPFRFMGLPKEMVAQRGIPARKTVIYSERLNELLPGQVCVGLQTLSEWIGFVNVPQALPFATRPFSLPELFILNRRAYSKELKADMTRVVLSVRGFDLKEGGPVFEEDNLLRVPNGDSVEKCGIAVSSWRTDLESWKASVMGTQDPDAGRYVRLCRLLDGVAAQPGDCRYLILPELSLPARWFLRIARKLHGRGISLISGIEYVHARKSKVRNQVWAALSYDGLGFSSILIYRQDKQRPALHEEKELHRLAGLKMRADKLWKTPPVLQHGNFRFALLVCSELTNIRYRADLRGRVDALFVPEWNPDTETFNALIEASALDIHAYIVQCNDRQYGDSRIRAPYRDAWKRDVLRVKGGVTDYCVIGEIDIRTLRQFQSSYRSPVGPFKPVPDGFLDSMDRQRTESPLGEDG